MSRLAVFLVLLLAALPLACGGDEQLSPRAAVAQAATNTADAGSARVSFTGRMSGIPGGPFTLKGDGAFDGPRGHMTFDMSGFTAATGGELGGELEMVMDGLLLYMKFPPELAAQLPSGKAWLRIDLKEAGKELGIDFEDLMQFRQADPTQSLQYLLGASDDFEEVGSEEVRGVDTTHYRGTVDLRKAIEQIPTEQRESFERALELTDADKLPFEVWIDDDGLARRMKYEQPLPPGSGGEDAAMALTMDMYDFGTEVDVEPPPDDEVIDIQKLMEEGV